MVERLTVRMYEMGFGDCFLVTFWTGDSSQSVLFDCGSLSRPKTEVRRVAQDVVAACTGRDGVPRLALVVGTHRHKDHVNGFDDPIWATVQVGEVWMPWTEDPLDPEATRIRERQSSLALALCRSLSPGFTRDAAPFSRAPADESEASLCLALNALTNEKAMATLHGGFAGNPKRRFLPKGKTAETRTVRTLPGVLFHVLGPSRDPKVIAHMEPPPGEAYLSAAAGAGGTSSAPAGACEEKWRVDEAAYRIGRPVLSSFTPGDQKAVEELADEPEGNVAASLDKAVNNTSLMLVIEVGDQVLLFPGDAQWGTWNAVLERSEQCALLRRTTLLKVSHHGSHNGTPKDLVDDLLGDGVPALVSTEPVAQWPGIPRPPLMEALGAKLVLARSDKGDAVDGVDGFKVEAGTYIEWEKAVGPR